MKNSAAFLLGAALLIHSGVALQATEARQRQQEVMRKSLIPDNVAESPEQLLFEDDEFGEQLILRRLPPPPFLTVYADGGASYSSNPLVLPDGSRGDFIFTGTGGFQIKPHIVREWEPALELELFAQYQVLRYDRESALDFDGQTAGFQASYALPWNMKAYGGWSGNQLEDRANNDRFYRESQTTLGVRKVHWENRRLAAFAGLQADLRHASPSRFSRLDYGPYAGVRVSLHENVPLSLRYRLAHQHYLQNSRDDLNSWFSLSLAWNIRPALSLGLQANYIANRSNRDEKDHNLVTSRLGATLSHSF